MRKFIPLLLGAVVLSTTFACNKTSEQSNTITQNSNQKVVVPAGTTFDSILQQELSTGKNNNNEQFTLLLKRQQNQTLKDAVIHGHLEDVVKAARGKKASLHLVIDDMTLKDGTAFPLDATLVNTQLETKTKGKFIQNAGIILGGTVAGHFLGNKTKFKHGALAGGAAATAFVLSSPGGEVVLKKGTNIKLKLKTALDTQ